MFDNTCIVLYTRGRGLCHSQKTLKYSKVLHALTLATLSRGQQANLAGAETFICHSESLIHVLDILSLESNISQPFYASINDIFEQDRLAKIIGYAHFANRVQLSVLL